MFQIEYAGESMEIDDQMKFSGSEVLEKIILRFMLDIDTSDGDTFAILARIANEKLPGAKITYTKSNRDRNNMSDWVY